MKIYNKPPLTYIEQLELLEERGLIIENRAKALHLLKNLSYYRLSGYLFPLLAEPKSDHIFKKGSKFHTAFQMYCFDRELKQLLSGDIEKIEISFRAKLTYVLSHKYDAFWYTYDKLFKSPEHHKDSLKTIVSMVNDSTEDFALKFNKNYINTYLPSWMALEVVTFTHLSKLYSNLRDSSAKSEIAKFYGLKAPHLENWLMILTYCRNICAHHSRLWNRSLSYKISKFKDQPEYNWVDMSGVPKNKAYVYICVVKYLIDRVNPNNTFKERLDKLFVKYPSIDKINAMAFPADWEEQPLWCKDYKTNFENNGDQKL